MMTRLTPMLYKHSTEYFTYDGGDNPRFEKFVHASAFLMNDHDTSSWSMIG